MSAPAIGAPAISKRRWTPPPAAAAVRSRPPAGSIWRLWIMPVIPAQPIPTDAGEASLDSVDSQTKCNIRLGCCHGQAAKALFLRAAERQAGKAGVEARQTAAAIEQLLRTAGPGRMGVGIDVEIERRPFGAVGRAGEEFLAIGHDDLDHVVIGVYIGLHRRVLAQKFGAAGGPAARVGASIVEAGLRHKRRQQGR